MLQRLHSKNTYCLALSQFPMAKILRKYFCNIFLPRNLTLRSFSCTSYDATSSEVDDSREQSFEEMFKETEFAKLGRPFGKIVEGRITHIVNNDMYIDFGWKFQGVVKIPQSKVNR